ncbi:MAG: hypothetical protein KKA36_02835 [Gammaproteobacteria bacterium]|nr:hypothetical protein [Gammaproteobacteria bacterium]MBU2477999.1 hypothetical protein [Gammaproteobacteria bacterium]
MAAMAAAATAANPLQAVLVDDDLYINQRLGLSFRKPSGWHYESIMNFKKLRDEYSVAAHSEVLNDEMQDWSLPIATITKYPLKDRLGPSIVVYVEPNALESEETLLSVMPLLQEYLAGLFLNYERVGNYRGGVVSGCETVEYYSKFIYERAMRKSIPVRNKSLCSVRDPVMYTMHMMDIPELNIDAQEEFNVFVNSIIYI